MCSVLTKFRLYVNRLWAIMCSRTKNMRVPAASNNSDGCANYLQVLLPDETLVHMCSFLLGDDLLCFSATCKRLYRIANDTHIWRDKCRREYGIQQPFMNGYRYGRTLTKFNSFRDPWKTSYFHLREGLHVHATEPPMGFDNWNHFSTLKHAVHWIPHLFRDAAGNVPDYAKNRHAIYTERTAVQIFLHPGEHEMVAATCIIGADVAIIGLVPIPENRKTIGTADLAATLVAPEDSDILTDEPLVCFVKEAMSAYLGYVRVRGEAYAQASISIIGNCTPLLDMCEIRKCGFSR